jgi:uncharacterized protein YkvS
MNEIRVIRNYSFWKHPIKWWKDRKAIKILDLYINSKWKNGLKEEVEKMTEDMLMYGSTIMDKDGKRINPNKLTNPKQYE